ncbi:MAG TPA: DUF488 domain-containing protein [Hanamia sp.]|nr:DUF488 domain-containing protein [Hanamia sp.]
MKKLLEERNIWTIGHSTRTLEELVAMLRSFQIEVLVDIRSFPGSRRYPQFNKEVLEVSIPENNIQYFHLKELGGRRKVSRESKHTAWRHLAFRGYADYMETDDFKRGIEQLENIATQQRTAYMCSEAVWWRCHRSMVSDYLKVQGWNVMHIMDVGKEVAHPYTEPARIFNGQLNYEKGALLKLKNDQSTLNLDS